MLTINLTCPKSLEVRRFCDTRQLWHGCSVNDFKDAKMPRTATAYPDVLKCGDTIIQVFWLFFYFNLIKKKERKKKRINRADRAIEPL